MGGTQPIRSRDVIPQVLNALILNKEACRLPAGMSKQPRLDTDVAAKLFNKKLLLESARPVMNISIDESFVKFQGRLHLKQFISSKIERLGIKLYERFKNSTGNISAFRIYEGNDSQLNPPGCPTYLGTSGKIVWELITSFLQKGCNRYVDKYYTSTPLFKSLVEHNTRACGTICKNCQGFPQSLVNKKFPKGPVRGFTQWRLHFTPEQGKIALCRHIRRRTENELQSNIAASMQPAGKERYKDKKDIFILSLIHTYAKRATEEHRSSTPKQKPVSFIDCNKYMECVDLADQVLQLYQVSRKSYTWNKKLVIYLFQVATYNSFVLYKKARNANTFLDYQEKDLAVTSRLVIGRATAHVTARATNHKPRRHRNVLQALIRRKEGCRKEAGRVRGTI
ncbi:unnamed protein product [Ranitomeya imitator]|uniref:PiggyBac transposable element-derived protein domain-containing protein n=1 Tax=Ranitomeya imitator TaxID=111125 RepID=A0ABN9MCX2_9NEOB|nr:unnamed protein product [Ranitomeya imitator]